MLRGEKIKIRGSKVSMLQLNLWRDYHLPVRVCNLKSNIFMAVSPLKCHMHINK